MSLSKALSCKRTGVATTSRNTEPVASFCGVPHHQHLIQSGGAGAIKAIGEKLGEPFALVSTGSTEKFPGLFGASGKCPMHVRSLPAVVAWNSQGGCI